MSGQQIGSFVGGVIGAYFGGPFGYAIGSAIGGAIGGYVDPTIIKGPRLTDATQQTANDGVPIPWGFGTFPTAGNIIWTSELRERKKEDDGKGTGVVNVTYHYYRSYAIAICQGIRQDDGTYLPVAGILQVKRNGKVVYDVSPDGTQEQRAQNAKFLRTAKFYLGSEDQLPDATIEAELGLGDAPAYPGTVYMVCANEELTENGGAIPQYEFVVSTLGEVVEIVDETLLAGRLSIFDNSTFPLRDQFNDYEFAAYYRSISPGYVGTLAGAISYAQVLTGRPFNVYLGYSASTQDTGIGLVGITFDDFGISNFQPQPDVEDNTALFLLYNDYKPDVLHNQPSFANTCTPTQGGLFAQNLRGDVGRRFASDPGGNWELGQVCGDGQSTYYLPALQIRVTRKRIAPPRNAPPGSKSIPDAPDWFVDAQGGLHFAPINEPVAGTFAVLSLPAAGTVDGRFQYTRYENGPAVRDDDPHFNDSAFWTPIYNTAVAEGRVPSGWSFGVHYPSQVQIAYRPSLVESEELTREKITVASIVAEACRRSNLSASDFDVSGIPDLVDGFKVATESTGGAIIEPLTRGYFFDVGEWDGVIHFVRRGGAAIAEVGPDDLCESDGDVVEETELQEAERLRKVHVRAIDPDAGFIVTTQTAERRTGTVLAQGEQTTEIPVVTDADAQAKMGEKKLKVGWSETRRFKFAVPYTRPELTVTDVIGLTDAKGRRQEVSLREMAEDSGRIEINEAMLYRASAYESSAVGVAKPPPTSTAPGLIGPTFGVAMNLPRLRSADVGPGVYIAGCGYLSGWAGAAVLLSVDGGATYQQVATINQPGTMGALSEAIGTATEPVRVFMNSGTLSSITAEQLALRQNAFAITTGGVSEIGQFQTSTRDTDGIYQLTDLSRGALGTTVAAHAKDDPFIMLASTKFVPIDLSHAGRTLLLKFVSFNTSPDDSEPIAFTFEPRFFGAALISPVTFAGYAVTVDGQPLLVTVN